MKKYNKTIIGLVVAAVILSPVLIFARSSTELCDAITQIQEKIEQRLAQKEGQLKDKQEDIENRYKERMEERETKLDQRREKWDENRQEHFAKLYEKAGNDEQKQAVTKFVETITNAVKERREAFDQAILDFQEELGAIRQNRLGVLADAVADYKQGVKDAFEKAKQDCEIKTLRQDLKDVRDQYREDVKGFESQGEEIQDLIEAKKQAMNEAKDNFKEILEQALAELKAVFPKADEGKEEEDIGLKQACLDSGGTIAELSCCKTTKNYPNLCIIGACGCSAENSREIKTCDCGVGKCFNGTECVAVE